MARAAVDAYLFPVLHGVLVLDLVFGGGGRGGRRPEHLPDCGEPAATATCGVLLSHGCLPARAISKPAGDKLVKSAKSEERWGRRRQ
jgi:hypothetical protein